MAAREVFERKNLRRRIVIMRQNYISIPFKSDSSNGFQEYNGIAKFSRAGIIFEFQSKFLGLIGGDVKEVRVSLDEILDIKFRKGIYRLFAKIQIRLKSFAKLSELPNNDGKINLKIKREDFQLAHAAYEQILQFIEDENQRILQEAVGQNEQLPPVRTSVNELFDTDKLKTNDLKKTTNLDKTS